MQYHFEILTNLRKNTQQLLDQLDLSQVNKIPEGFNNNIIWNAGHAVVIQYLLTYGLSGVEIPLSKELIKKYRKGSQASDQTSQEELDELRALLTSSVEQLRQDYEKGLFKEFKPYIVGLGTKLNTIEEAIMFNNSHEGVHLGYMMAQRKLV